MAVPFPARRHLSVGLALAVAAVLLPPVTAAAAGEIGVVDFQLIFEQYDGYEDAQRTYDRELKEWDEEAKEKRDAIDQLAEEIDSQRLMLSEERLQEKQDELRRLREEYQNFAESIWGVNGQAARRNAELTGPISEKIREVVARLGDEKNLDVILDASTGGVVWSKDDVNITQTVLDELALSVEGEPAQESGE